MLDFQAGQIIDRFDRIGGCPSTRPEELGGDHRHVPVDTHDARPVAVTTNCSRDMCSVGILSCIVHAVVVVYEIPPVNVVDVPVAVVVNPVDRIVRIRPDIVHQIGVLDLDTFVNDADKDVCRTGDVLVPRFLCLTAELIGSARRPNRCR